MVKEICSEQQKIKDEDHIGQLAESVLRMLLQNEMQRNNGGTTILAHNYPNEWVPGMNSSLNNAVRTHT